jgi:hypothetical protein
MKRKHVLDSYFFAEFSTLFPSIISKASSLCSTNFLSQEDSKVVDPILHGIKKILFLHFKRYNLAIHVVNFFETFSTYNFNSPKQDPTVESKKDKFKISIYTICTKSGNFRVFFSKPQFMNFRG